MVGRLVVLHQRKKKITPVLVISEVIIVDYSNTKTKSVSNPHRPRVKRSLYVGGHEKPHLYELELRFKVESLPVLGEVGYHVLCQKK